jgi:hypothetical protein
VGCSYFTLDEIFIHSTHTFLKLWFGTQGFTLAPCLQPFLLFFFGLWALIFAWADLNCNPPILGFLLELQVPSY